MKTLKIANTFLLSVLLFILVTSVNAQVPQLINFSATLRNTSGQALISRPVQFQLTVLDSVAPMTDKRIYKEHRYITSNNVGEVSFRLNDLQAPNFLITLPNSVSFDEIPWETGNKFLIVDIDTTNLGTFFNQDTIEITTTPFAFACDKVTNMNLSNATNGDALVWNSGTMKWEPTPISATPYTPGPGIDITNHIVTNTEPDQIVTVNAGSGINVSGAYPNFTIANTAPSQVITLSPGSANISITGTYPNFTIDVPNVSVPTGTIVAYGGTSIPGGWKICDGSPVSRITYASLFNAIGEAWGIGDGINTFNLPDMRGMFLRGVNGSSSNDPDVSARYSVNGGNSGNAVGSKQNDIFGIHSHGVGGGSTGPTVGSTWGGSGFSWSTDNAGGNETRPKNVYVYYIIKY